MIGSGVSTGNSTLQGSLRNPLGYGEITRLSLGTNTSGGQEYSLITAIPHIRLPNILPKIFIVVQPTYKALTELFSSNSSISKDTPIISDIASKTNVQPVQDRGILELKIKKSEENSSHFVSYKSSLHSIGTEYSSQHGTHRISTELTLRDELPVPYHFTPISSALPLNLARKLIPSGLLPRNKKTEYVPHAFSTSQEVLACLNSSSKSAIKYTFTKDLKRQSDFNFLDSYMQSSIELAVPTGVKSASYVRTDLTAQSNNKISCFLFSGIGMIASFSGSLGKI